MGTSLTQSRFQVMPDLSDEDYQALKEDIRRNGVMVPIEFDKEGNIIDGHHRFRAFSELIAEGVELPPFDKIVRQYDDEQHKFFTALVLNTARRQLTPEQRRELAFKLRKPPYNFTMRRIADALGVSVFTISTDLSTMSAEEREALEIKSSDGRTFTGSYAQRVFITGTQQLKDMQNAAIQAFAAEQNREHKVNVLEYQQAGAALLEATNETSREGLGEAQDERRRLTAFSWYGGKASHLNWLLPLLPATKSFVDVFGGSAAVLLNRPPSPIETYNDLDNNVVNFFRVLRADPAGLIRLLRLTPHSREERRHCYRAPVGDTDLESARRFFVLARQTFGGGRQETTRLLNSWRHSVRDISNGIADSACYWQEGIDGLAAVAARLRDVQIDNYPALKILEGYDTPQTLFYCDPPYVHETRSESHKIEYHGEMTEQDHIELAAALHKVAGKVALSGYRCKLYDDLYNDWYRVDMPTISMVSDKAGEGRDRIESLWTNYKTL